jgi:hypothetical protein
MLRSASSGLKVAAALDEDQLQSGEAPLQVLHRRQVHGGVLADGGVRTAAGLDADDTRRLEGLAADEELGVLLGVDVIGDHGELIGPAQPLAQGIQQGGLAGTDRTTDTDPQWG